MTEQEALERWPDLEPADRERRRKLSEAATRRHQEIVVDPETGEERRSFGGPQPGSGRPRKKRLSESIAGKAQEERELQRILEALWSGLDADDERVRVQTAEKIAKITVKEEELQLREREFVDKPIDELRAFVAGMLAQLSASGELPSLEELMKPRAHYDVDGTTAEDSDREDGDRDDDDREPAERPAA